MTCPRFLLYAAAILLPAHAVTAFYSPPLHPITTKARCTTTLNFGSNINNIIKNNTTATTTTSTSTKDEGDLKRRDWAAYIGLSLGFLSGLRGAYAEGEGREVISKVRALFLR